LVQLPTNKIEPCSYEQKPQPGVLPFKALNMEALNI